MKKKLVAVILATAMIGTALAGCGSSSSSSSSSSDSSDSTAVAEVGDDGLVNGLMYPEGLPIVEEGTYSFSMFCDDSTSTGEFYMLNELYDQTNVEVDLVYYPYETATERLNLSLNAGDYADVIAGWTLSDSMILTYGVDQGVFIPLEDIFEAYCPNISAILDLEGVREEMTAPDGHIYTIPYVCGDTTVGYSPYINTLWLENLGLDMPTTTEEFEAVLKAFKEQDANGNGDATDEIPFSTDPNNKHLEAMAGYFGLSLNKYGFSRVDGETVYGGYSTAYREFLSWFNSLYQQGLIDTEIFTQDSATWEGKGNRDMYGVSIAYGASEFAGYTLTDMTPSEWEPLPVLNADDGGIWLRDTNGFSVYRTQAVITDNAENPEIIARWFDNAFELENGIGISHGPVGIVTYEEEDGWHKIDTSTLDEETQEALSWSNLWPQSVPKYLPADFEIISDNPVYDEKAALEEYYEQWLTEDAIPSFWIGLDDVDTYSEIATSIQDYFTNQQALFIAGEQDVNDDAVWESYIAGLQSLQLDEYLRVRGVTTIIE